MQDDKPMDATALPTESVSKPVNVAAQAAPSLAVAPEIVAPADAGDPVGAPRATSEREPAGGKTKARRLTRKANHVRDRRIEAMMSKAELARRANISVLTIDRIEKGYLCRMDTKRKILEALGLSLADRVRVFGEEE